MRNKYFELASKELKDLYHIDVIDDVLLGRKDRVMLYGDVSKGSAVELHVISGSLSLIGFDDRPTITLNKILAHFEYKNKYAEVAGKKEYYDYVYAEIGHFDREGDVTFPISVGGKRLWLRLMISPVEVSPYMCIFTFVNVTELLDKEELIYEKTNKDALTSLFNKYTFDYHYGLRYQFPNLHVLYMDLDDFKIINDDNGHLVGNVVLQRFADILKSFEQGYDAFYRLGGDEFVGLIFGSSDYVKNVAEKIIAETQRITIPDAAKNVSVSIGIIKSTRGDDLIRRADELLYKVKKTGKNNYLFDVEPNQ